MTLKEKESIKAKILQDIESLKDEILKVENKYTPIAQDCSLDSINKKDMQIEQEMNNKIVKNAQIRLNKLLLSLKQINNDDYGVCKECDEDIALNRLMILPESLYCVECLNELES